MEISSISSTLDKHENDKRDRKVSKFRNYASQIYAAFATNLVKLATGTTLGFTPVLIAALYKDDAEIEMSLSEISWFSSQYFMGPVGCLCNGLLSQRIGSRSTMLIAVTFYAISMLIFHFATTSGMLAVAQALQGFFASVSVGPGINYVIEITQPELRSALTASTTFMTMSAGFIVVLLSNFLHWRTIALVILAFPIVGFLAVCTIPESPHWLASKSKFKEALTALSWLRGWSPPETVSSEFNTLKENYTKSSDHMDSSTFKNSKNPSRLSSLKSHINAYTQRSFYVPLSMTCLLFSLHNCIGYAPMVTYCIVIFTHINAPIEPHLAASIFDAMRLIGALLCIFTIHHAGKKKLIYVSLIGATITFSTASTALLLRERQIHPEICQWTAVIAMMTTTFLTSAGIDKVVYILNAEMFPTRYRSVGTGIGLFAASVGGAIMNKIFLSLMAAVTLSGVFLIFGVSCVVTCVMFHFTFPETEGKTLQEIQERYNDGERLEKLR